MIKKESLPDRPKFCRSMSAVRHLFWRLGFWFTFELHVFKPSQWHSETTNEWMNEWMNEIPSCDSLKSNNVRSYNYNPGGPLLNSKPLKLPLHWVFHYATPATLLAQPGGIFMNFNKKQILTFCYVSWRRLRQPQTWGNVWLASGGPRTSTVPSACSAAMSVSQGDKLSSFLTFQQRWLGVETCKKIITTWIKTYKKCFFP